MNSNLIWVHCAETKITIHALFITVHALKNIKNRSHGTIQTFKNYFATVLSVFSFSNNRLNQNGPIAFSTHEIQYLILILKYESVGAFSDRIGLPPAITGWAASYDGGP